ncbi:MAG: hypothetical protein JSW07_15500 [bacterium]|nr:MAG: hypothetical protein JSW07_15500 [bacterium]
MAVDLTIDMIIEDLQAIEPKLSSYENKYKLLSPYFYKIYQSGKFEEHPDFVDWAGLYQIRLKRLKRYEKMISQVLENLPLHNPVNMEEII